MRVFERTFGAMSRVLRREPWWAEFWSAATAIGWSSVSLFHNGPMDAWPSMQVLLQLGGERFWHTAGLGLGLAQLGFLLLDRRWLRWAAAVALCWFWAVLTVGVWAAVPGSPGVAVYAGWCGTNVFSIIRLMRPVCVQAPRTRRPASPAPGSSVADSVHAGQSGSDCHTGGSCDGGGHA